MSSTGVTVQSLVAGQLTGPLKTFSDSLHTVAKTASGSPIQPATLIPAILGCVNPLLGYIQSASTTLAGSVCPTGNLNVGAIISTLTNCAKTNGTSDLSNLWKSETGQPTAMTSLLTNLLILVGELALLVASIPTLLNIVVDLLPIVLGLVKQVPGLQAGLGGAAGITTILGGGASALGGTKAVEAILKG